MKLVNNLTKFTFWASMALLPGLFLGSSSLFAVENGALPQKNPHKVRLDAHLAQVKILIPVLMDVLHDLFLHTEYWKVQKLSPLSYFLSKDPTKWIHRKREWKKIDSNLEFLVTQQEHNAYYLGVFSKILQEHTIKPDYSQEKTTLLGDMLAACLSHYPDTTKRGILANNDVQGLDYALLIKNYRKNAKRAVAHCSQPSHFQRNWLPYVLGTAAVLGTGYFVYKNQDNLANWAQTAKDAVSDFWHDHITKPYLNVKNRFLRIEGMIKDEAGVEASLRALEVATERGLRENYPHLNDEERRKIIHDVSKDNLGFFVLEDKGAQENSGILSWMTNKFSDGKKLINYVRIDSLAKHYVVDQFIYEASALVGMLKPIIAAFPAALLVYLGFSATRKTFTYLTHKNTYQPVRKALRNLHRIFNKYGTDTAPMGMADQGYSFYWVEQFKKHASTLVVNEHINVLDDLADLENSHYHPYQKLAAIQRMYYNYHFLLPTGS